MHYNTVNKHLKNLRVQQRQLKDLCEATSRRYPEISQAAGDGIRHLDHLIDLMLNMEYDTEYGTNVGGEARAR
jgi:hypothetical protein